MISEKAKSNGQNHTLTMSSDTPDAANPPERKNLYGSLSTHERSIKERHVTKFFDSADWAMNPGNVPLHPVYIKAVSALPVPSFSAMPLTEAVQ
jgi:hypothetical protein